jgi:hypothetical protein
MRDGPACLGADYLELRYESLLDHGPEEVGRLLAFLGVDAAPATVAGCLHAARFERSAGGRRRGEEDSASPARVGLAGDWRRVFTPDDRRIFKDVAGAALIELGYESDENW